MKKTLAVFMGICVVIVLAGILVWRLGGRTTPGFLNDVSPNGYETLLMAARKLGEEDVRKVTNGFGEFLERYDEVFKGFSTGLTQRVEAPARSYDPTAKSVLELMALRKLSDSVVVKAKRAEEEGDYGEAAKTLLDIIRFGQALENGPLINFMIGSAIELMASKRLEALVPKLAGEDLEGVSSELMLINDHRASLDEVIEREKYFIRANSKYPWELMKLRVTGEFGKVVEDGRERHMSTEAYQRVIAATMGAGHYYLKEGKFPGSVLDLVPGTFTSAPRDPYSGQALMMAPGMSNVVVYSVGPNQRDDSGKGDDVTLNYKDTVWGRAVVSGLTQ